MSRMKGGLLLSPVLLLLVLLLPSLRIFHLVAADRILAAHTAGDTFGRSSHEPKFKIAFHSLESPFQPDENQESMVMSYQNGTKYNCFLPKVEEKKDLHSVSQQNSSTMIMEADRRLKLKTPDEILDKLKDQCLLRQEGWWSYELCYHQRLRQVHTEERKVVQEFVLGKYNEEATAAFNRNNSDASILKDPRSKDVAHRYHAHVYTNGTVCDLTNQPRETEVRFVCSESPEVMISSIKETSTCKYAVTVQVPLLCKHPMFQQERSVWHTINCNEMPQDDRDTVEHAENGTKDALLALATEIPVHSET
ncbi:OS-9-like protein [Nymphaea thermarum]|nr:OS-9-like protein [Nymphaea thermarum]